MQAGKDPELNAPGLPGRLLGCTKCRDERGKQGTPSRGCRWETAGTTVAQDTQGKPCQAGSSLYHAPASTVRVTTRQSVILLSVPHSLISKIKINDSVLICGYFDKDGDQILSSF